MERKLDLYITNLSETGFILADYLNEDYEIFVYFNKKLKLRAYFIWKPTDEPDEIISGRLKLITKPLRYEIWNKLINFDNIYGIADDFYSFNGMIDSNYIKEIEDQIINELDDNYNKKHYDSYIEIIQK